MEINWWEAVLLGLGCTLIGTMLGAVLVQRCSPPRQDLVLDARAAFVKATLEMVLERLDKLAHDEAKRARAAVQRHRELVKAEKH